MSNVYDSEPMQGTNRAGFLRSVEAARAAVEIVRALAAPVEHPFNLYCYWCGQDMHPVQPMSHEPDCPYKLAYLWVEANPE